LAFRPNPDELLADDSNDDETPLEPDNVYRPPKLAPVPYMEKKTKKTSGPIPSTLRSLQYDDASTPYAEKSTGLGVSSSLASARARELQRMTEFEEENMTRLVMNKKESKRRRMDEADIALGGVGASGSRRHRGGLQDEFRDIFQSANKSRRSSTGDGYEELREKAKRGSMLERSRTRDFSAASDDAPRKRARFENAVKKVKRKSNQR
jgi:U3 small nucleolar ribonucleoprotein protein LCP5